MLLDSDDVTDPSDFPTTHQDFRDLDTACRCPICKEILNAPVLISVCGHSFCSRCIRESLDLNALCPQCRTKASHSHLIKNSALEAITLAYLKTRPQSLQIIQSLSRPALVPHLTSSSKRKLSSLDEDDGMELRENEDASDSMDEVCILASPKKSNGSPKKRKLSSANTVGNGRTGQDNKLVECPVCQIFVGIKAINAHIDGNCAAVEIPTAKPRNQDKKAWQTLFNSAPRRPIASTSKNSKAPVRSQSPPPERLPKEAYDTLKDKQIRERLQKFDLPTSGSRNKLQARHEQWVVLYNSNQDQAPAQQKSIIQLRTDLASWEAERENDVRERTKAQESLSNMEEKEYQAKHQSQFQSLVQQARATRSLRPPPKEPSPDPIVIDD